MLDLNEHLSRGSLGIIESLQHVVDRPAGHTCLVQDFEPVRRGLSAEALRKLFLQFWQMPHAVGARAESGILGKVGRTYSVKRAQPVRLIGATDHNPTVRGLKCLVGSVERMGRAHGLWGDAGRKSNGRLPVGLDQRRLEERGLDPLTFASLEAMRIGSKNAHGSKNAGGDVGKRRAAFGGGSSRSTCEAHDAAHGLRHEVEAASVLVRAGPAEAGEGAVDEPGMVLLQILIAEAEALHHAWTKILYEDVCRLHELA